MAPGLITRPKMRKKRPDIDEVGVGVRVGVGVEVEVGVGPGSGSGSSRVSIRANLCSGKGPVKRCTGGLTHSYLSLTHEVKKGVSLKGSLRVCRCGGEEGQL